jgi:hypothetical protein
MIEQGIGNNSVPARTAAYSYQALEREVVGRVDGDAVQHRARGERAQQRPPAAPEVGEAEEADLAAAAEARCQRRRVPRDRARRVGEGVAPVAPVGAAQLLEIQPVRRRQLHVTRLLEVVPVRQLGEGGPEDVRRDVLRDQLAEEALHRVEEVLRAARPAEHAPGRASQHVGKERRAGEVAARLALRLAEPLRQLAEDAERRIEPAGDAALGSQRDQVVPEAALAQGEEVGRARERVLGTARERREEPSGRVLEQRAGVAADE